MPSLDRTYQHLDDHVDRGAGAAPWIDAQKPALAVVCGNAVTSRTHRDLAAFAGAIVDHLEATE